MKKNLFGVVSVALALALAITSFGCESGNDDPVMLATDADNPITEGFTYFLAPSEYTYNGDEKERPLHALGAGTYGSWVWDNYKDGVNKWNRLSGTTTTTWDEATRGTVKGDAVGDVIKTKFSTFTLNADGTWSLDYSSSNKEVLGVNRFTSACDGGSSAAYDDYITKSAYAAYVSVPAYAVESVGSLTDAFDADYTAGNFVFTPGYSLKGLDKVAIPAVEAALALAEADENELAVAEATALLEILKAEHAANEAGKSITKVVIEETDEGGVKVYYADKIAVYTVETEGSTVLDDREGTYKFLSGGYLNGTILITSENYVFDDDSNVYYDTESGIWRGVISVDFPAAATDTRGSVNQKKARTLTISNGVLTANAYRIDPTNDTNYENGFYFDGVYTTYDAARHDATDVGVTGLLNRKQKSYAWTIVQ